MGQIRGQRSEASEIAPGSCKLAGHTVAQVGRSELRGTQKAGLHVIPRSASSFGFRGSFASWILGSPRAYPELGRKEWGIRRGCNAAFAQSFREEVNGPLTRPQRLPDHPATFYVP